MAVTSPDNIWTPDSGDDYALTVDLARMADDVQDALNSIRRPALALYGGPAGDQAVGVGGAFNLSAGILSTPSATGHMSMGAGTLTCQIPGIYEIKWSVTLAATGANQGVRLVRNGTIGIAEAFHGPWSGTWNSYAGSDWVSLDQGDTLHLTPVLASATLIGARINRLGWKYIAPED